MPGLISDTKPAELAVHWHADVGDHVQDLAWSPDGELLLAATISGPVFLYHGERLVKSWTAHPDGTNAVSWAPDSSQFATIGLDGMVRRWTPAGEPCGEHPAGGQWAEHVCFNRDGTLLASSAGRTVRIWCGTELLRELTPHASTVTGLCWRPGRTQIAILGYGGVAMVDPTKDAEPHRLPWKGSLLCGRWNPQGSRLACGLQDNAVHVWQPDTEQDWAMDGYPTKVREVAWDRTGKVLTTGGSPQITCWDFHGDGPSGQMPTVWDGHVQPVTALAGHPADDVIASGGRDGAVVWWRRGRPTHIALAGPPVSRIAWRTRQAIIAVGCEDGLLAVYGKT